MNTYHAVSLDHIARCTPQNIDLCAATYLVLLSCHIRQNITACEPVT